MSSRAYPRLTLLEFFLWFFLFYSLSFYFSSCGTQHCGNEGLRLQCLLDTYFSTCVQCHNAHLLMLQLWPCDACWLWPWPTTLCAGGFLWKHPLALLFSPLLPLSFGCPLPPFLLPFSSQLPLLPSTSSSPIFILPSFSWWCSLFPFPFSHLFFYFMSLSWSPVEILIRTCRFAVI